MGFLIGSLVGFGLGLWFSTTQWGQRFVDWSERQMDRFFGGR